MMLWQAYVDTVVQEIRASTPVTDLPLKTVFFGGGTPSLIPPKQLDQVTLIGCIYARTLHIQVLGTRNQQVGQTNQGAVDLE